MRPLCSIILSCSIPVLSVPAYRMRKAAAHQRFGVTEDVVLQELMQLVEAVVMHEKVDDQLVQVVLKTHRPLGQMF